MTGPASGKGAYQPGDVVAYDSNEGDPGYEPCWVTVARNIEGQWINVVTSRIVAEARVAACPSVLLVRDGQPATKPDEGAP